MKFIPAAIAKQLITDGVFEPRGAVDSTRVCFVENREVPTPSEVGPAVETVTSITLAGGSAPGMFTGHIYKPLIRIDIRESTDPDSESAIDVYTDIVESLGIGDVITANGYRDIGGANIGYLEIAQEISRIDHLYPGDAFTYTFAFRCQAHRADLI